MRDPVDVDQLHVGLDAQLCGDCQPGKMNSKYCKGENCIFVFQYLPKVEHDEHQEVQGLFDECRFVSNTSFGS